MKKSSVTLQRSLVRPRFCLPSIHCRRLIWSSLRLDRTHDQYMAAILRGCWIVSYDWLRQSLQEGRWAHEAAYEIVIDQRGHRQAPGLPSRAHTAGLSLSDSPRFLIAIVGGAVARWVHADGRRQKRKRRRLTLSCSSISRGHAGDGREAIELFRQRLDHLR